MARELELVVLKEPLQAAWTRRAAAFQNAREGES
jgi:hypothetical protein